MIAATREHEELAAKRQRLRPPVKRVAVWGPLLVVLLLAVALVAGIWRHVQLQHEQEEYSQKVSQVTVEFVTVHPDNKAQELILPGNLLAVEQTTVYARASGYVERWLVDLGDIVQQGQTLAVLATPDLDQQLAQARQQVATDAANTELTRITAERWMELEKKKVVSLQDGDEKEAAYQASKATLKAAQANLDRLVALQGFKNVTAPFQGRITARQIDVGSLVSEGSGSAGTALFTLAKTNPLNIFVNVPQTNAPSIKVGENVKLLVDEYASRDFQAKIVRTAGALDPASRTLSTEIEIPNEDGALYAGMYARVKFSLEASNPAIFIPAETFVFNNEGSRVATVTQDGKVHWQIIQIGRDFGKTMEVLSGLQDGERVIVNPTDDLTEGLAVQANPVNYENGDPQQQGQEQQGQAPPAKDQPGK